MPRARRAIEIFLSLGASAGVLATALTPSQVQAQPHTSPMMHLQGGEGGEGGEAGQSSRLSTDADILLVLAQMQGHLLMAQELFEQHNPKGAEPHVSHPVDELYGTLEPALRAQRITPFLTTLEQLRQQVRLNPQSPRTRQMLTRAQQAIAVVAQSLAGMKTDQAQLVAAVVPQLAQTAVQEYEGALAGDRVVEVIEYQDARGFLRQALLMVRQTMASQPAATGRLVSVEKTLSAMLAAFPSVQPPRKAVMSLSQLQHLQQQLRPWPAGR